MSGPLRDIKAALGNASKPDITHVRKALAVYTARPCEYGDDKYERANFRRPTDGVAHGTPTRADFERFRAYLRAALNHLLETLDSMETHQATDPQLQDVEGMKRAAFAADTDATPGAKVGASMLPHVAHTCSSLNMAITQAVDCGLLPRDPGTPWRATAQPKTVQEAVVAAANAMTSAPKAKRCTGIYDDGIADGNLTKCSTTAGCGFPGCPSDEDRARRAASAEKSSRKPRVGDRVRITEVSESGTAREGLVGSVAELITVESPVDSNWNLPYEVRLKDGWTDWVRAVEVAE